MDVLVPFAAREPKTRLAAALSADERAAFARAMLLDVCEALVGAGREPTVLSTAPIECPHEVLVDERPLTAAVNARLDPPVAVVMADLALSTSAALEALLEAGEAADLAVAPGLGGGTNALVVRHREFRVDYHGASVRDHRRIAREVGASVAMVDSFRLALDVDEPRDLVEVLLHAREGSRSREWLEEAGFGLETAGGRVLAARDGDKDFDPAERT